MYIGEIAGTLRIRSQQHYTDYKKCSRIRPGPDSDLTSFMWDHHRDHHDGQNLDILDYQFNVIINFNDPMTRQIEEAVRIQQSLKLGLYIDKNGKARSIKSLNRKNEHFTARKRFTE